MVILYVLLALVLLLFYLIAPTFRRHKDRALLKGKMIAHRGLHGGNIPENSLAAFRAAIAKGYAIENDIHLTADGELVVFHDDTLRRMCGVDAKVESMTLAELKALCLGDTEETVPTLRECLALVDGKVPLLIEFKVVDGNTKALCEAAAKLLYHYDGAYCIQSFYPQVLLWYRRHRKCVCRGQLAEPFRGEAIHRHMLGMMLFNFLSRPDFVSYEHSAARHPMRRTVTALGALPLAWTIRSKEELDKAKKEFDGYIFEGFEP